VLPDFVGRTWRERGVVGGKVRMISAAALVRGVSGGGGLGDIGDCLPHFAGERMRGAGAAYVQQSGLAVGRHVRGQLELRTHHRPCGWLLFLLLLFLLPSAGVRSIRLLFSDRWGVLL
jgi:hypothetical protein